LSAIAGAAQAQSSVTIYGVLDAGYINQKSDGTTTNARAQSSTSSFGQSAEQTSRLGFKGSEDLGGVRLQSSQLRQVYSQQTQQRLLGTTVNLSLV